MKNKTIGLIAGGIAGVFALAAGMWSFYPENRELVANVVQDAAASIGIAGPAAPPPAPARNFIKAGFTGAEIPAYMAMSAQGCSQDGKVMRLAYAAAIVEDERQAGVMDLPGVRGNKERYLDQRRDDIAVALQEKFKAETKGMKANTDAEGSFDLRTGSYGDVMQVWLQDRAEEIHEQLGLKIAIRMNAASGLRIALPRSDAIDACTPEGRMPEPLLNARGAGGKEAPKPF